MHKNLSPEFVYQLFALVVGAILVHAAYAAVVRPRAAAVLEEQKAAVAVQPDYVSEPNVWVILKDYEQELEIILFFWGCSIMGWKFRMLGRERRLFDHELAAIAEGESILPEDTRAHARALEALPDEQRERLLPQLYLTALHRFRMTRNIQDVSDEVGRTASGFGERMDSDLSLVRYIAWAIPSIGFIGTVRGIGQAMGQAQKALTGDMSGVTEALGTAFNSTLVALLLSMVLMFLLHQLQQMQERLVLDAQSRVGSRLIQNLVTA